MRDRDEIVQTAKAIVKQLQPLTSDDTVDMLLQRLHDAKRGFPTGGEPPAAADEIPDPFTLTDADLDAVDSEP